MGEFSSSVDNACVVRVPHVLPARPDSARTGFRCCTYDRCGLRFWRHHALFWELSPGCFRQPCRENAKGSR
eukprot:gene12693-biopygen14041